LKSPPNPPLELPAGTTLQGDAGVSAPRRSSMAESLGSVMIKRIGLDLFRSSWRYLALVLGGTSLFLVAAPVVGYLPYGDRPGPGWYGLLAGASFNRLIRSFSLVFGWALLAVPSSLFAILPLHSAVRLLEWAGFPRPLNASVGALVGAFGTLYVVLGMGWYIALDSYTPLLSALLGAIFGAWIVPRRPPALPLHRLTVAKAVTSSGAILGIVWIMFPAIPVSLLGLRSDSLTIDGTLYRGISPVSMMRIRDFTNHRYCTGTFVESVTDAGGRFHFQREYSQKQVPQNGACEYAVTVCYPDGDEWRRLSSSGRGGPCGTRSRIEFRCNLDRPGESKCDTRFGGR